MDIKKMVNWVCFLKFKTINDMLIETKFNVGDKMWCIHYNSVICRYIIEPDFSMRWNKDKGFDFSWQLGFEYELPNSKEPISQDRLRNEQIYKKESELFKTKEELIASL